MDNDRRFHLWIPDEEVETLSKTPRIIPEDRGLSYSEHGARLSQGLQSIVTAYSHLADDALKDEDILIFKMVLPEGEDIFANRAIADKEGLKINAVRDKRHAIVSTNKSNFKRLSDRVGTYRSSGSLNYFQYVDSFEPFTAEEKQASSLKRYMETLVDALSIDVQMMFMPNLPVEVQDRAAKRIASKIKAYDQSSESVEYSLADGTVVLRAQLPVVELTTLLQESAIYRIEQTGFFCLSPSTMSVTESELLQLDPAINVSELPVVAVVDSGVHFPQAYEALVPVHWKAPGVSDGYGGPHGTEVASKVVFRHIGLQIGDSYLKARARVIDCNIYGQDSKISQEQVAQRIEAAVASFYDVTKIFNLSSNVPQAIDGDELSILGYQLDSLMKKYGVKFVISSGNHELAKTCDDLEEILDDTDARIAEPADSMLGITVGAVAGTSTEDAFSQFNEVTAYTRIGPGFAGYYKPDLVAYGANLRKNNAVILDPYACVLAPGGQYCFEAGTSFTAPVVAGDLAELTRIVPDNDVLLAQALLYNGATRVWDTTGISKDEAVYAGNCYGRGVSNPDNCKPNSQYKVTFLRRGTLKKSTKEHVRFLMPTVQASVGGNNNTRVTVTCITDAPIDKSKGEQYLGACITASLHKLNQKGVLNNGNPKVSDNKGKWDTCNHFHTEFSKFSGGMWEVWLDLFSKWDIDEDTEVPYCIAISIEDLTKTNDIYKAVIEESAGRFRPIESVRIPVRS